MAAAQKKPVQVRSTEQSTVSLAELRASEARLADAQALAHLGSWDLDPTGTKSSWSGEMSRLYYRDPAKPAPSFAEFLKLVHPEDRTLVEESLAKAITAKEPYVEIHRTNPALGPVRWLQSTINVFRDAAGRPISTSGTALDITDQIQAGLVATRLQAVVESSDDAIISKTLEGVITSWNPAAELIFGYSAAEVIGQRLLILVPPERHGEEAEILARIAAGERIPHFETVRVRKDGRRIDISASISPIKDSRGRVIGASKIARDITQHKQREGELSRLTRLYAALSQVNQAIVWSPTRDELFRKICRLLVEQGGFRMAWIGWNDPETHQLVPVAEWGDEHGYLRGVKIFTDDRPEGRGPAGTAFREGRHYICNDLQRTPVMQPWLEQIRISDFRAVAVIPIRQNGGVGGTLVVYAGETGFFQDKEVALLEEAASDVSFALDNFAREAAQREAEEVIRRERDFSEAVLNSLPGVFYLYNRAGRFLRWNRNFEQATGYSGAEIAAMHPLDFFAGPDKVAVAAKIEAVFQQGESYVEASFVAKDGRVTPYCFTGLRAEVERQTCLVGVGIDLTERRGAEAARQASEARYRTLFDNAADGIVIADVQSYYIDANASLCRMLGYPLAELIGRHASDVVVPAELPYIGKALNMIKTKARYQREWIFRRKDGSTFPAEVIGTAMPDGNLMGVIRDITERKQAEDEQQRLTAALAEEKNRLVAAQAVAKVGSWETNLGTGAVAWSDEIHRIFETDPARFTPTHAGFLQFVHPDDRVPVDEAFLRSTGSHAPRVLEHRVLMPDGRLKIVEERWQVFFDDQDRPVRAVGTCQDITARKRAEEELRTAERQLHALIARLHTIREEEAKRIARELHDDLGQQLTALNMELADLELKLADCTAKQREQFARMRAGVDHTIEVVQKISGELRLGQLDVLGLTAAVEWQVQDFAKRSAINCRILRLDEDNDLNDAESTTLFRILQETLTNVARHAGASEVEVSLQSEPERVSLRVSDNGRGITAAEVNDLKSIGLLGMRERAQLVGGEVTITGATGKGTTVVVRIPRSRPPLSPP